MSGQVTDDHVGGRATIFDCIASDSFASEIVLIQITLHILYHTICYIIS